MEKLKMNLKLLAGYLLMSLAPCLVNCEVVEECKQKGCMSLVISKALPIEFWLNGELTYNNTVYPNMQYFPFNQQFLCSDNIKLKVFEERNGNAKDYRVDIYDETGTTLLATVPFTRTTTSFPTIDTSVISQFGSGIPTTNIPWNTVTQEVVGNLNPPACASKFLNVAQIIGGRADLPISFSVPYTISTIGDNQVTLQHFLYNSDLSLSVEIDGASRVANGSYTDSYTLTPTFVPVYVVTRASFLGTTTAAKVKINVPITLDSFYSTSSDYELNFKVNDLDLCNKCLLFKINTDVSSLDALTDFTNTNPSGSGLTTAWTLGTTPTVILTPSGESKDLTGLIDFLEDSITINYNIDVTSICNLRFRSISSTDTELDLTDAIALAAGNNVGSVTIPFTLGTVKIGVLLQNQVGSSNPSQVNSIDLVQADPMIAYSEIVEFSNDIEENVQLFYKSTEDFAGIKYNGSSDYFMIRFPGTFFHPNDILETSVIETTETIITNATALKKERRLQIDDIPEYMQDKLALVLMHSAKGSLKAHNVEWSASSAIEDDGERPGSYPMKAKTTMLTRKKFLYRNAI